MVVLQLKCLNYAPGPMDTEMQADVRGAPDTDRISKQWFIDMHAQVSSSRAAAAVGLHIEAVEGDDETDLAMECQPG